MRTLNQFIYLFFRLVNVLMVLCSAISSTFLGILNQLFTSYLEKDHEILLWILRGGLLVIHAIYSSCYINLFFLSDKFFVFVFLFLFFLLCRYKNTKSYID